MNLQIDRMKKNSFSKFFKTFFGLRMVKTALAISITIAVAHAINLKMPIMAGLSAVVTMSNSVFDSFHKSIYRMISTILGVIIAAGFRTLNFDGFIPMFIGVLLIINFCNYMKWKDATSLALMVFIVVMLQKPSYPNYLTPIQYGINRIIDTSVGLVVGVLVNAFVFPPNQQVFILKSYEKSLADCEKALIKSLNGNSVDLRPIITDIHSLNGELEAIKNDSRFSKSKGIKISDMSMINAKFYHLFGAITTFTEIESIPRINDINRIKLQNYFNQSFIFEEPEFSPEELENVFNYNLDEVLNLIESLKNEINQIANKIEE